jgi:Alginate lyase
MKATSVMDKTDIPSSGNKHEYLSLSPYYWPNPSDSSKPWILHDGLVNPQSYSIPDRQNLDYMTHRVKVLTSAYYDTNNSQYSAKATELLRVWFLNKTKYMTPNLRFAEQRKWLSDGTPSGIIQADNLPDVIDAIMMLRHSTEWTISDQKGMESWFAQYLNWLLNSDMGSKEAQTVTNHGTWYTVQVVSIGRFLNRPDIAQQILATRLPRLVAIQILPDGK